MPYNMPTSKSNAPVIKKNRLVSLDALRGFDMFWIIGASAIADGLAELKIPGILVVVNQLKHSTWNGFTFYDLIFPLFVFITGVSLFLSVRSRLQRGEDKKTIINHVVKRSIMLFLLGIVYNGITLGPTILASIRVLGVLQRIALCYFFTALLLLYIKPQSQAVTFIAILVGYWVIMRFVPVPGYGPGVWTEAGNLAQYIDSLVLPGRLYHDTWDPEGLLSTVPAVATCILGTLVGQWLRSDNLHFGRTFTPEKRVLYLILFGISLVGSGLLFSILFPINKSIWTSSFVLLTGGLSTILLAVFHWTIDIRGYKRWAFPFVVIGMNSIFIYMAAEFIPFSTIANWIVGVELLSFLGPSRALLSAIVQLSLEVLLLLWLYKRKIFIRL